MIICYIDFQKSVKLKYTFIYQTFSHCQWPERICKKIAFKKYVINVLKGIKCLY